MTNCFEQIVSESAINEGTCSSCTRTEPYRRPQVTFYAPGEDKPLPAHAGINPIVTFEKQLVNMIGNLV